MSPSPLRWWPLALAALAPVVALHVQDVPLSATAWFVVVQALGYTLPGTLLWRALHGGPGSWLHDLTFGSILAHAAVIPTYVLLRWLDAPWLLWALPVATVLAFVLWPPLRRHWRGDGSPPPPAGFVWLLAGLVVVASLWYGGIALHTPISGPRIVVQSTDHTFLLALAAEVRHHLPPMIPYVTGEPLTYHWFGLADAAAFTWQSPLALDVVLFRLQPMWSLLISCVAFALVAQRLTRRWAATNLTVVLTALVGSANLTADPTGYLRYGSDGGLLLVGWIGGPTLGFAMVMAIGVVRVAIDLVRRDTSGAGPWLALVLLTVALSGSKVTAVPVVGGGIAVALGVQWWRTRRLGGPVLGVGVVLTLTMVLAQVLLYGGEGRGLRAQLGGDFARTGVWMGLASEAGGWPMAVALLSGVLAWFGPLVAAVLLLRRHPDLRDRPALDPAVALVAGVAVVSVLPVFVLAHPGFSQYAFLRVGLPFGQILAAWGLVRAADVVPGRRVVGLGVASAVLGLGLAFVAQGFVGAASPPDPASTNRAFLALVTVVVVLAVLALAARAGTRSAVLAWVVVGACLLGIGAHRSVELARRFPVPEPFSLDRPEDLRPLPEGGVEAARYLRDHSDADELVATNNHCRLPIPRCDSRAFWISAYAERRVLVQGWGYSPKANADTDSVEEALHKPFWDPDLLRRNDAVFTDPSRRTLGALLEEHPVRWLVVDRRFPADVAGLRRLLPEPVRFGQTIVFEVPANAAAARAGR